MANNVKITSRGIKKILKRYNPKLAIAEYIWNGFDAKADKIEINYELNALDSITELSIKDNGIGINLNELNSKFNPFFESEKTIQISSPKHTSIMHGKNGVGRLTFFTFANTAKWTTTYNNDEKKLESGYIKINVNGLNAYTSQKFDRPKEKDTGTTVTFSDLDISKQQLDNSIVPYLIREFCWFLELNKPLKFTIFINGIPLDYSQNIIDFDDGIKIYYEQSNTIFDIKFIQWKESLLKEFSKYYFLDDTESEVYKDYTTLNNKGDEFYHSVYIQSDFFKEFDFKSKEDQKQTKLFGKAKSSPEYKYLIKEVNKLLKEHRKPFLREYASHLIEQYEQDGIMPTYQNEWEEKFKKPQLEETIIGLYEVQPKLFSSLNIDQKKTFVRLLDLILDSNERENLFKIIEEVIDLDSEEREDLVNLFQTTKLNRIIDTIKLIEDRYKAVNLLKELVFNRDLEANEVDHVQKLIESHYWLFGEQYHLLTAAEPKFEEALRRYHYLLYHEDVEKKVEHPNKYKEMDIFACRQNIGNDRIDNIVIELKHPKINLGRNQYNQVDKYLETILSIPEFNASNMYWEFYLIGNDFANTGFIERQIENAANHGIPSLINWYDKGRVKVYAKRWSEIFTEFEIKHNALNEKLRLERDKLTEELNTADEAVEKAKNNTAVQPDEIKIDGGR